MKIKIIIASVVIASALLFGATSFIETNIQYTDFQTAITSHKKVEVKRIWLRDRGSIFDVSTGKFIFYMEGELNKEMKVAFDGAKPNNFELAHALVVKGRYEDECFQASEILTKCPSKYEATAESMKQTL